MMIKKRYTLLLLFVSFAFCSYGQRFSVFSTDPSLTVSEMKEFFATAPSEKKKEAEIVTKLFEEFWNNPFVGSEMQDQFIEVANVMMKRKMRPFPYFEAYINAYVAFSASTFADEVLSWSAMINYHVTNDFTSFHKKMDIYVSVFSSDIMYKSSNARWRTEGAPIAMGVKEEPFIEYQDIRLIGASSQDSMTIYETSGFFFPSSEKWKGKGGEVHWDRAGLWGNVHAELEEYDIELNSPKVVAENVTFHYAELFPTPIKGVLEEKAGLATSEEKASYPRFKSYENVLSIPNIYENVDYIGGFEMRGASIMGAAVGDGLSQLNIKRNEKIAVTIKAKSFLFREVTVLADNAKISIYLENDSIYHASAKVRYNEPDKELMVSRETSGLGRAPFMDSYHKMDIYAEAVFWNMNQERVEIKPIFGTTGDHSAFFESQNYYDDGVMRKIQGFNDVTPLYTLFEVFKSHDYQNLPFQRVVAHFKRSAPDIRQLLIDFAADGFIEYDMHKDEIIYRSKIARYLNNQAGKSDYDQIRLESSSHYASIDMLTHDMRISGCEFFALSDAQIVNVYPSKEQVIVKKNRDMNFSGRVFAGLFDFVAHNCIFKYDPFEVEMNVIDSMIMYVEDENAPQNMYGEHQLKKINSVIEELSGTVFIDKPRNKSGKIDFPDYPIFESRKGGKVFYEHPFTLGGHYKRDQFHYVLDLFRIVNLDNFEIDSMRFTGYLMSGGIFPDIHEPLVARPDFSLGFVHHTGENTLPMYGGKGHYKNMIDLSNKGLRGKGDIQYITSTTSSDSLVFYLDRVAGRALQHTVVEQPAGTEYPPASVKNALLNWEPYDDQMFVHTGATPMSIFEETELTGFSKLTPHGMYGGGLLKFKRADLTSRNFYFKHHELLADTSNLRIYALDGTDFAFTTDNYNSHIDFQTRKGKFVSNGEASEIHFVKNEIKANASKFDWDPIDENILIFKWEDDPYYKTDINATPIQELVDMEHAGSELAATDPGKRGLKFNASQAEFDFGKNIIQAEGVRFINVGDGSITPLDGKITVLEKADIQPLTNARILASREEKRHELYDARVKIESGNRFKGSGYYDYIDENQTKQILFFDTLWCIDKIRGDGKIPAEMDFKFSPHFGFDGRVELHSDKEFLYYVGGVEFINDCDSIKPTRLRILQEINPEKIMIEIHDRSRDVTDRKAVVAIASTNREGRIYTCFGAAKDQFNDSEYISVFGFITYDKQENSFKAASKEKLEDPYYPGNMIALDVLNCIGRGTGTIDMGAKLGRVDFVTNGTIINYMKADSAQMHLTTSIDFFFNDDAMKIFNKALENSYGLDFVDVSDDPEFELALIDLMGEETYQDYQWEVNMSGQVKKLPKELQVQFLFSNIDFEWDKVNSTFVSQDYLPLIICGATQVYKTVPGRIVVEKRGSRNRLYIYFDFDGKYFLFQFENNIMYAFSSESEFNDAISNTKANKRALTSDRSQGLSSFSYRLGNKSSQKRFLNKYPMEKEEEEGEE